MVGGGNSAGQAAMFLSRTVAHVHILVRANGLAATMSDYLVQRILSSPRITLHPRTEITALAGDTGLRSVTWTDRGTGASETRPIGNVFVMIGAEPNTDWLDGCLELDGKGFVVDRPRRPGHPMGRRGLESTPSATCGRARSSGWRRASARGRWSSRRCTVTSIRPPLEVREVLGCAWSHFNNKSGQFSVICLPDFNIPDLPTLAVEFFRMSTPCTERPDCLSQVRCRWRFPPTSDLRRFLPIAAAASCRGFFLALIMAVGMSESCPYQ